MKLLIVLVNALLLTSLVAALIVLERRQADLRTCRAELDNWQGQLNTVEEAVREQKREDDEIWEARIKHVEYVLWEVHEIPDVADTELEGLCRTVSVHSNLWPGTELMGFGSFNDHANKRMLTCRWIADQRKDEQ